MASKSAKMTQLLNYRLRIVILDGRHLVGQMVAFDKHMNLVIVDCEEFRPGKKKKMVIDKQALSGISMGMQKRTLGLVIVRGENIVSISVEAGPPPSGDAKHRVSASTTILGPGIGRPMVRGLPVTAPVQGLAGPVRGIGTMPLQTAGVSHVFRPGMPVPPTRPPGMPTRPRQ